MKAIVDNKIYDTDKATEVATFIRKAKITVNNIFFRTPIEKYVQQNCTLYRTDKGSWFEKREALENVIDSTDTIEVLSDEEVKKILINLADAENYEKYFEKLEEA